MGRYKPRRAIRRTIRLPRPPARLAIGAGGVVVVLVAVSGVIVGVVTTGGQETVAVAAVPAPRDPLPPRVTHIPTLKPEPTPEPTPEQSPDVPTFTPTPTPTVAAKKKTPAPAPRSTATKTATTKAPTATATRTTTTPPKTTAPPVKSGNCPTLIGGGTTRAKALHQVLCAQFPQVKTYGGARPGDWGFHGSGRAIDVMVGNDSATGQAIANWARANASAHGITEVIWAQKIWTTQRASEGWRLMADRGSVTDNHYDHVHISVR